MMNDTNVLNTQKKDKTNSLRIITVFGEPDVGKTTLIWAVYNKLMETGGELTYFHIVGADARDFHAIVVWEGKIIALCSIGDIADPPKKGESDNKNMATVDDWKYIKEGINLARDYKAEIIINSISDFFNKQGNEKYDMNKNKEEYEKKLNELQLSYNLSEIILDKSENDTIEIIIKKKQETCRKIIDELRTHI